MGRSVSLTFRVERWNISRLPGWDQSHRQTHSQSASIQRLFRCVTLISCWLICVLCDQQVVIGRQMEHYLLLPTPSAWVCILLPKNDFLCRCERELSVSYSCLSEEEGWRRWWQSSMLGSGVIRHHQWFTVTMNHRKKRLNYETGGKRESIASLNIVTKIDLHRRFKCTNSTVI